MLYFIRTQGKNRKTDLYEYVGMPCHVQLNKRSQGPRSWLIDKIGFYHLSIFPTVDFEDATWSLFSRLVKRQRGKAP